MYSSVQEHFKKEYPILVRNLDNPGVFWPAVRDNTISNKELDRYFVISQTGGYGGSSASYQACVALMRARLTGKLPNPG